MIQLHHDSHDAAGFLDLVEAVVAGMLQTSPPPRFFAVHVDNWFDQKWLKFSGKMLGAFGVWKSGDHLTLPPFVPNRVLSEEVWVLVPEKGEYSRQATAPTLHSRMWPERNRRRTIASVVGDAAVLWYSGNSTSSGRGAIMAYQAENGDFRCWYASLAEIDGEWKLTGQRGVSREKFLELQEAGSNLSCDSVGAGDGGSRASEANR